MSLRFTPQQIMWGMFLLFGGMAVMYLLTDPAFAVSGVASPRTQSFSCSGGKASGSLIASAADCPKKLAWDNIFSYLVCNIEVISSQLFGNLYCGMITELTPVVKAALTLAVVFFGVGFTIGVIPATGREFITFLLKIAFIWAFATQAEYMIGYGFNFLLAGLRDGTVIAMSSIMPKGPTGVTASTAGDMYKVLDAGLLKLVGFATATAGDEWGAGTDPCKNAIFAALAIMSVAFPPIFLLSILLLAKIIMVFLRSCFGYMFSLVGLAFLMILAPIFLSFALFKPTRYMFDKWLGYLCSFTLQMVIIFTFIAMIISMNPSKLIGSLTSIIVPVQESYQTSTWRWPWQYCTLCAFEVVEGATMVGGVAVGGTPKDLSTPGVTIDPATDLLRCIPGAGDQSYRVLNSMMPDAIESHNNTLMEFAGTAILSLIILAYIIDQMLHYVPSIAWRLAGSLTSGVYAPQFVGGGYTQTGTVNAGPLEYLETAGNGFYRGFTNANADGLSSAAAGIEQAGRSLMVGTEQDPGLADSFVRFFINPTRTNSNDF